MRKLKLQVQMTVDGYIGGPNGEMDWLTFDWDDELKKYVAEITAAVDCIVLGRKLAQGFIPHWRAVAANPDNPEFTDGLKFTNMPKVVFSRTLTKSEWPNTVLAVDDLASEIRQLKAQAGQDIMAYGGASFVSSLIKLGLVDEYHLFINPAAIGKGLPIFSESANSQELNLIRATTFSCGIAALHYTPKAH